MCTRKLLPQLLTAACVVFISSSVFAQTRASGSNIPWEKLHKVIETTHPDTLNGTFMNFATKFQLPLDASNCKDGKYTAISASDNFGYHHVVMLSISNGKITHVHYDEANANELSKRNDTEYNEAMHITGTSPNIAYDKYEKQLLDRQKVTEVDVVSGATYSLYRFCKTVSKALEQAQKEQ